MRVCLHRNFTNILGNMMPESCFILCLFYLFRIHWYFFKIPIPMSAHSEELKVHYSLKLSCYYNIISVAWDCPIMTIISFIAIFFSGTIYGPTKVVVVIGLINTCILHHQWPRGTFNCTIWKLHIMTASIAFHSLSYSVGFPCPRTNFCTHPWRNPPCLCRWGGPAFPEEAPFHCRSATSKNKNI